MKPKKKRPAYAARKKAFDDVMSAYRDAKDVTGGVGSTAISDCSGGTPNPAKPSLADFRCDVERVIHKCVSAGGLMARFTSTYIMFDSDNPIDIERFADKVIGSGRHNLEQGIGAEFIKRGIYPLHGKRGYFHAIRMPRGIV
jgi:hypothetical protein